jgi:uncharacterized protein (TIGR02246 family)
MASAEEIARSYWRAEESRDLDRVLNHFADNAVMEMPGAAHLSGDQIRDFYVKLFDDFPKLHLVVGRVIGDGNSASLEYVANITNSGGESIAVRGVNIVDVDGKRMTRVVGYFDRRDFDGSPRAR